VPLMKGEPSPACDSHSVRRLSPGSQEATASSHQRVAAGTREPPFWAPCVVIRDGGEAASNRLICACMSCWARLGWER
jgi:hypothetical protein